MLNDLNLKYYEFSAKPTHRQFPQIIELSSIHFINNARSLELSNVLSAQKFFVSGSFE